MAEKNVVLIKVISQKGNCAAKYKVGDEWVAKDDEIPAGICPYAFHSLFPFIQVLMFGGAFPWEADPDAATVACPDAENPVVFELRRVRA